MEKVALITGAARGIGRATAIRFAKARYNVVINYHSTDSQKVKNLAQALATKYQIEVLALQADVSDENAVKQMVTQIVKQFSKIDVLVNNAGIVYDRNFSDITVEDFMQTLSVNTLGAFIVSRETAKYAEGKRNRKCFLYERHKDHFP